MNQGFDPQLIHSAPPSPIPLDAMDGYVDVNAPMAGMDLNPTMLPLPERQCLRSVFLPPNWRQSYSAQAAASVAEIPMSDARWKQVPTRFRSVRPLDKEGPVRSGSFGYPSTVFKTISKETEKCVTVRRVDTIKTDMEKVTVAIAPWLEVFHPNIVHLREAFVENGALFFVHDYIPCAKTLKESIESIILFKEDDIWNIACCIIIALRYLHVQCDLPCRNINARNLLLVGPNRAKIGSVGLRDVTDFESVVAKEKLMERDIQGLGLVMLQLAAGSMSEDVDHLLSIASTRDISNELCDLAANMVKSPQDINKIACNPIVVDSLMEFSTATLCHVDTIDSLLSRSLHNGRLLSSLIKLNIITNRPENANNPNWKPTGNRYVLELFQHYLFHQLGAFQEPIVDFGHIIEGLMKLDVGYHEDILLNGSDNTHMLVTNFDVIRNLIKKTYKETLDRRQQLRATHSSNRHHMRPPVQRQIPSRVPHIPTGPSRPPMQPIPPRSLQRTSVNSSAAPFHPSPSAVEHMNPNSSSSLSSLRDAPEFVPGGLRSK
eukprot:TRINITY_DN24976_c0_g1_i1.p1 TRINITY_DN24976_c0_g1~~TRINITY_DN24976_c0_g1_i1.p1  ORF type:complete len:546 (+),score=124.66 TRINITY_DN24976_c0_g1_i1:1001-2638(+)